MQLVEFQKGKTKNDGGKIKDLILGYSFQEKCMKIGINIVSFNIISEELLDNRHISIHMIIHCSWNCVQAHLELLKNLTEIPCLCILCNHLALEVDLNNCQN